MSLGVLIPFRIRVIHYFCVRQITSMRKEVRIIDRKGCPCGTSVFLHTLYCIFCEEKESKCLFPAHWTRYLVRSIDLLPTNVHAVGAEPPHMGNSQRTRAISFQFCALATEETSSPPSTLLSIEELRRIDHRTKAALCQGTTDHPERGVSGCSGHTN